MFIDSRPTAEGKTRHGGAEGVGPAARKPPHVYFISGACELQNVTGDDD